MQDTDTTKCRRCKRTLRSAASIAAGVGPVCAAREAVTASYSPAQQDKAFELLADHGLASTRRTGVWQAISSDGTAAYLVTIDTCNCPGGQRRGRAQSCYHTAAVRARTTRAARTMPSLPIAA